MKGSSQASRRPSELRVRVERFVDYGHPKNEIVSDFSSRVGRAINGVGTTKSLGSMSLSLLSAFQYSQVRNRLSANDRNRLNARMPDFVFGLEERMAAQTSDSQQIAVAGLALWGKNVHSRRHGGFVKLGFNVVPKKCPALEHDIAEIKTYFSDNDLDEPPIDINKMHITFGEVALERLARGQNKMDPHTLVPAGLVVPSIVEMGELQVEAING